MKNFINELGQHFPINHYTKAQAAMAVVCREVIRANPLPPPEQFDQEMRELFAE